MRHHGASLLRLVRPRGIRGREVGQHGHGPLTDVPATTGGGVEQHRHHEGSRGCGGRRQRRRGERDNNLGGDVEAGGVGEEIG